MLLLGEIGVGKTSFVNTALSVLRNKVLPKGYTANSEQSVTTKVQREISCHIVQNEKLSAKQNGEKKEIYNC